MTGEETMPQETFRALVVRETGKNRFSRSIEERTTTELPKGDVLIRVRYSSLNYKDALSASGNRGVTRAYPHTPGIDAAGEVEESASPDFKPGEQVLVTGYDLGMNTAGGFGQYIRVPAGWVVRLPAGLTLKESMVYGTAGFTASLSVAELEEGGVTPESGDVLVTGATGGVGSMAVAILAKIGYSVVALSGKADASEYLKKLGAAAVLSREEGLDDSPRPLLKGRWAGVVDTVGGQYLATALKATRQGAVVTCCGLVASPSLETTVFPFILRGARLIGIDSASCPYPRRLETWQKISGPWKLDNLDVMASEITLEDLEGQIEQMLQGKSTGRKIVRVQD
jgi:putative YhdH/YhfP family quinone oxidoreductase